MTGIGAGGTPAVQVKRAVLLVARVFQVLGNHSPACYHLVELMMANQHKFMPGAAKSNLIALVQACLLVALGAGFPLFGADSSRAQKPLFISSAVSSSRNYALTNAQQGRVDSQILKSRSGKHPAQLGGLSEQIITAGKNSHRLSSHDDSQSRYFSVSGSQIQGRAPPYSS